MANKPFEIHVAQTSHFEFEVWAETVEAAEERALEIWRNSMTIGQWQLPDEETEYRVREKTTT